MLYPYLLLHMNPNAWILTTKGEKEDPIVMSALHASSPAREIATITSEDIQRRVRSRQTDRHEGALYVQEVLADLI